MSKYTTEVRYICEHYAGLDDSIGFNSVEEVIANSRTKIFDFNFPIFDESYRSVLETKILKHYYTREIGAESVGLWKLWLDTKLNEIMPFYNKWYESELLEFNPLHDVDLTTDKDGNLAGERQNGGSVVENNNLTTNSTTHSEGTAGPDYSGSSQGTRSDNNWDYYSDTPQGGLNGIENNTYLTNVRHNVNNATSGDTSSSTTDSENENDTTTTITNTGGKTTTDTRSSEYTNTEEWLEHISGKRGTTSYSKLLQEYRETFVNIDMKIINELSDLFMNVW